MLLFFSLKIYSSHFIVWLILLVIFKCNAPASCRMTIFWYSASAYGESFNFPFPFGQLALKMSKFTFVPKYGSSPSSSNSRLSATSLTRVSFLALFLRPKNGSGDVFFCFLFASEDAVDLVRYRFRRLGGGLFSFLACRYGPNSSRS